ncbi:FAD-binding protein [Bifidobacterium criceti]|uniref:UDP-N-acetylenolpyruvoylglucosamine reductase n=1 Tax=Bifidobacterium criceti TaxID=1960969 RepID=A0A2A2EH41_9BIFI|nr:FAD-binding protein [Bifidobacterium criceti]PAU68489.1 UDP-N-acetylenolpyruvoylglucosamine reductase [Bifidobacterium criceti]
MTTFAELTTIGVGGNIDHFMEPTTRASIIEEIEHADAHGIPVCVIGGGSNLLAADGDFHGIVVRDARRLITVPDEADPVEDGDNTVHVTAEAGCNWDDLVAFCVERGLEGIEGLSGIPGNVGASVVQNIGAYGQEVATSVESVEVWDREDRRTKTLSNVEMQFGYRSSLLKTSMYKAPGVPNEEYYPSPRYIVLSVTFALTHTKTGTVNYPQLAAALHANLRDRIPIGRLRDAVLDVRASKAMLEDATRYRLPVMADEKRPEQVERAIRAQQRFVTHHDAPADVVNEHMEATVGENEDYDRHSCGSFFMNPIVSEQIANTLPDDSPKYPATLPDGSTGVKLSAAWLIDHAGFHKGYRVREDAPAALSSRHTLALTNRGGATCADILELASAIRDGVRRQFNVTLVPEPVIINAQLS